MSAIELRGVHKHWDSTRAVDGVSLRAEAGQLVALLGPSGCGKSTTLRLIAGLERSDGGQILIGERDVTHLPSAQRGIAMVFQNYALFPHLTVGENIVFGLSVRRLPRPERAQRLAQAAELLGLQDLLARKPAQLSGGQRQRVALARAIVAQASVCLMDEPLSNLDAQLRQHMRGEIRALQQRLGMTMVYVTHDQTEAMTMADHVVLMRAGRIEQQGTPAELYERPATAFAAGFIGAPAMNLFPVELVDATCRGLTLGVRPEHLRLGPPGSGLAARVEAIEYLGAETMVVCSADRGPHRLVMRCNGRSPVAAGQAVGLHWAPDHQHGFDAVSGLRADGGAVPSLPNPLECPA
jgi:sn-glycerol 3-phosphate transport system ATP-binding protein